MKVIVCIPTYNPHQKYLPTLVKHLHKHGFKDILLIGEHTYEGCQHVFCPDHFYQMYKRYLAVLYCLEHYKPTDKIWFMDEDDNPLLNISDIPKNNKINRYPAVSVPYIAEKGINLYIHDTKACTLSFYTVPIHFFYEAYSYLLKEGFTIQEFKTTQAMEDTVVISVFNTLFKKNITDVPKESYMHLEARSALYNKNYSEKQFAKRLNVTTINIVKTSLFIIRTTLDTKCPYNGRSVIRNYGDYNYYIRSFLSLHDENVHIAQEGFDRFVALIYMGLYLYEDPKIITFPEDKIKAIIVEVLAESLDWAVQFTMDGKYEEYLPNVYSYEDLVKCIQRYEINIPSVFTPEYIESLRHVKYITLGIHEYRYS